MMKKNRTSVKKLIPVSFNESGRRIDNFLISQFKNVPKSVIYRFLRKGKIRVNKRKIKPEYKLIINDKIFIPPIEVTDKKKKNFLPSFKKVEFLYKTILYEDNHLFVVNKPSGIAVHGGSGLSFGVIEGFRILFPKLNFLELVHRLDRDTSGILLLAKKYSILRSLHKQLREKTIQKNYLALIRGCWKKNTKIVKVPLLKSHSKNKNYVVRVNNNGNMCETHFSVKEHYKFSTLMRCKAVTGRTHQIRVHAQYVGHPIALDNRYGDNNFNRRLIKNTGLTRLFLHAEKLKCFHPNTGKIIVFKAPIDEQLKNCLRILRN